MSLATLSRLGTLGERMPYNSTQRPARTAYQACFFKAIGKKDLNALLRVLKGCRNEIDIDKLGKEGISALHKSCIEGQLELVQTLLDFGANIEVKDPEGWTPLHACAAAGEVKILHYLLLHGANVMTYNKHGQLPIDVASEIEIIIPLAKSMSELGHNILAEKFLRSYKAKSIMEMSAVKLSIEQCKNPDRKQRTLKKEWSSDSKLKPRPILKRSQSLTTYLPTVDESGVKHRLYPKDSIDRRRKVVSFPAEVLCQAYIVENDHEDLERLVLSGRLEDINRLDENGISALHLASLEGSVDCLSVLVENGARIDNRDPIGWTPLHAAVAMGNVACVKILLDAGADISSCTDDGESVYDLAQDDLVLEYLRMVGLSSNSKRIHRQRSRRLSNSKTFSICSSCSSGSSSGSE